MNRSTTATGAAVAILVGVLAAVPTGPTGAQDTTAQGSPPAASPSAAAPPPRTAAPTDAARTERREVVDALQLEEGANSFTEGQARGRFVDAGFADVRDLRKDDRGFWRGRATRDGSETEVAMDFRGRIAAGPAVAALGSSAAAPPTPGRTGADAAGAPSDRRPDGAPGNPPSTATGRAVDRMQGETPRPDGAPGNPPGTAAGRAVDRATGGNATGANPAASGGMTR